MSCLTTDRATVIWYRHVTDYKNSNWSAGTLDFEFHVHPANGKMFVKDPQTGKWVDKIDGRVALRFRSTNSNQYNTIGGRRAGNCSELAQLQTGSLPLGMANGVAHPGSGGCHKDPGIFGWGSCDCCYCVVWTTLSPYSPVGAFYNANGTLVNRFKGKIFVSSNKSTKSFEPVASFDINNLPKEDQQITFNWINFKPCGTGANISPSSGKGKTTINVKVKKSPTKIAWTDNTTNVVVNTNAQTGLPDKTIDLTGSAVSTSPILGTSPTAISSGFQLKVNGKVSKLTPSGSFDVLSLFPDKKSGSKTVTLFYPGTDRYDSAETKAKKIEYFGPPPAPVINSVLKASSKQNSPFSYKITASNSPQSFSATLPAGLGLQINNRTGEITGTLNQAGNFNIVLSASNISGTGTATLALTVIAPPPTVSLQPAKPVAGKSLTVTYFPGGRNLSQSSNIFIHYGHDNANWTTAPGFIMTNNGDTRTYTYTVPSVAKSIVMCFNDGKNTWDNNNNQNWTFEL